MHYLIFGTSKIEVMSVFISFRSSLSKAVVAGPVGRRAPDHFLDEYAFRLVPFFSRFGSFFFVITSDFQFINAIINNARCACHP